MGRLAAQGECASRLEQVQPPKARGNRRLSQFKFARERLSSRTPVSERCNRCPGRLDRARDPDQENLLPRGRARPSRAYSYGQPTPQRGRLRHRGERHQGSPHRRPPQHPERRARPAARRAVHRQGHLQHRRLADDRGRTHHAEPDPRPRRDSRGADAPGRRDPHRQDELPAGAWRKQLESGAWRHAQPVRHQSFAREQQQRRSGDHRGGRLTAGARQRLRRSPPP